MLTAILFLLILAILILVHELGHFAAAKFFGIRVDEFGLGFPPKLFSKKYGETEYTLNAIPFGGFVKIYGEDPVVEQSSLRGEVSLNNDRSFVGKSKWIQAIVLSAGVTMNILFGYLLISIGFMIGLPAPVDDTNFKNVKNPELVITSVLPGSPAEKAGLISGDVIVSASSGMNVLKEVSPASVSELISKSQSTVKISYRTGKSTEIKKVEVLPSQKIIANAQVIGITMDMVGILKLPVGQALIQGFTTSVQLITGIAVGLWHFFVDAFTFHTDLSQVSGPVGIAKIVGEASSIGFVYLMSLVALISFNLAVINLVPFPALDGGRLFFIILEAITRKKVNPTVFKWINMISFSFLIILMVVISIHDIFKLF
jgi:regulator of sigma E protease